METKLVAFFVCDVFYRQQQKVFLITYVYIALSNTASILVGFYWNHSFKKVDPLVKIKKVCIVRFTVNICERIFPALIFSLNYVFLFCFHSLKSVFKFANSFKYLIEFESRLNDCLRLCYNMLLLLIDI